MGGLANCAGAQGYFNCGRGNGIRQTVTAQQQPVTRLKLQPKQGGLYLVAVIGLKNDGFLGMGGHISRVQPALVDQRLHKGVILGQLLQAAAPQEISPGISDVNNPSVMAIKHNGS